MATTYQDPVCGMEIEPGQEAATSFYHGNTYYFCSQECMHTFENEPEKYARTEERHR